MGIVTLHCNGRTYGSAYQITFTVGALRTHTHTCSSSGNKTGSQKVPGMLILHCNGRTYGNAYLITFTVRALRTRTHTRTHLLHGSCHCWKPLLKASVGIFCSSALAFYFMSFHGCEMGPLEAHSHSNEQPKVTGSEIRRVRWLSDVWFGVLCRAATSVQAARTHGAPNRRCHRITELFD
jgi:hypothetical protein